MSHPPPHRPHPHHRPPAPHHPPPHVTAFITMALPGARIVKARWRVPIAVLIAQAAQETGWGRHVRQNAYFGIKGRAPDGQSVNFGTHEVIGGRVVSENDQFRAYTSFADAADDYGRFLNQNPRYQAAFGFTNDPLQFVQSIGRAGYATDPNYVRSLTSIITSHHLADYDRQP